jgi:hypothetical protein
MNDDIQCWPVQREICADLGYDRHGLKGWTAELVSAGYLSAVKELGRRNITYTLRCGDRHSYTYLPDWDTRKDFVTPVTPAVANENIGAEIHTSIGAEIHTSSNLTQVTSQGKGKGTFSRKRLLSLQSKRKLRSLEGKVITEIPFEVPRDYEQFCLDLVEFVPEDFHEFAEQFFFEKERNGWTANNGQPICYWRRTLVGYIATICNCEKSEIAVIE